MTDRPPVTEPERQKRRRVMVMLAALGLLLAAAAPYRQYYAAKQRIRTLERQEAALDRKIVQLEAARDRLATDAEIERLARGLGYVRPGEVPFVIVEP
jgi:cell division protein FtsB